MFVVCCVCRGLCEGLITRPEESYGVCVCVCVCMSLEGTTSLSLCPKCENILLLLLLYSGNQVKEMERGGVCGKNGVKEKCV